ncbi:uncharacterized protein [Pocillopora verrucosa]|uniref:uncharacterized protein isoform X2 n=1 Tax=Pocillopora verrucosa TaxID=203993 RepID=UPI0033425658
MSKLAENFGGNKNTVYHFIRELIQEEEYAWFVNTEGRFRIKWEAAVERYIEYRAKKNPRFDISIDRSRASNSFREALLLRCYQDDGTKEYKECRKFGENNKIVEREFQLPSKVFHLLFGSREKLAGDQSETSGISVSDPELTQEDNSLQLLGDPDKYVVDMEPEESRLKGGCPFCVSFHPCLDPNVTSVRAIFVKSEVIFGNVELAITTLGIFGRSIPGAPSSGWANVILKDQNNTYLGSTEIFYFPDEAEASAMIQNSDQFKNFSEELAYHTASSFGSSDGNPQRYGAFGNAQQVQFLRLLIYNAAREGAQQFIEMILSTSAGRLVFNAYKDSRPLPEVVARDHGHNETACYLEGMTKRFSVEISASKEYPNEINWSELAQAAAEEAQKCNAENESCHLISDLSKDAGYLGDLETSSSEPHSLGSEDDISIASKRECNTCKNESGDLTSDLSKDAGYLGDLKTSSKEPQSSDSEDDISIMSNKVNGDENLARAMNLEVIDVHDVQSLQDTEVAKKYREKEVMFPRIQEAVQCHPTGADKLDNVRMEGKISDISAKDSDWAEEEISTNSDNDMDQLRVVQDISPSSGSVKEREGGEKDSGFHSTWCPIEEPIDVKMASETSSELGSSEPLSSEDLSEKPEDILEIIPKKGPMEGGSLFVIVMLKRLPPEVKSAWAEFGKKAVTHLERANDFNLIGQIPASDRPGNVTVRVHSSTGRILGKTEFCYYDQDKETLSQFVRDSMVGKTKSEGQDLS